MNRANSSLPVPLSPRSNTVALLAAAFLAISTASFHPPTLADDQMIPIATFFRENFDFPLQRLPLDGLADDQLDIIRIERPVMKS